MPAMRQPNIAAIEAGGTKFVVAVGRDIANSTRHSIPTTSPIETLSRVARIINDGLSGDPLNAMGVASFGPCASTLPTLIMVLSVQRQSRVGRVST